MNILTLNMTLSYKTVEGLQKNREDFCGIAGFKPETVGLD